MPLDTPPLQRLPGHSLAEDEKILRAGVAFRRLIFGDPRVSTFFDELDRDTGLLAAAARFRLLGTTLARRIGLGHRSALWAGFSSASDVKRAIDTEPMTGEYQLLVEQTMQAREDAIEAYHRLDHVVLAARLEMFVRELKRPWRWLTIDLENLYIRLFLQRLVGHSVDQEDALVYDGAPFHLRPGETLPTALQRYVEETKVAAEQYVKAQRRMKKAGPRTDGRYLERRVEWFYGNRVKSEPDSLTLLAREFHTERSNITEGIKAAEGLLDRDRFPN